MSNLLGIQRSCKLQFHGDRMDGQLHSHQDKHLMQGIVVAKPTKSKERNSKNSWCGVANPNEDTTDWLTAFSTDTVKIFSNLFNIHAPRLSFTKWIIFETCKDESTLYKAFIILYFLNSTVVSIRCLWNCTTLATIGTYTATNTGQTCNRHWKYIHTVLVDSTEYPRMTWKIDDYSKTESMAL